MGAIVSMSSPGVGVVEHRFHATAPVPGVYLQDHVNGHVTVSEVRMLY
jgi:hypothetical protein